MGSISKYDYFIRSIKNGNHLYRQWILAAFSVAFIKKSVTPQENDLVQDEESGTVQVYVDGAWITLEGVKYLEIPYVYHEIVPVLKAGDIDNALDDIIDTTWGEMLFNQRVLVYAAGTYIPYMQSPISVSAIGNIFAKEMLDDPIDNNFIEGKLYVRDLLRLGQALSDLGNYELFVPSVDKVALSAPANNDKLKEELFERYKDQLDDPIIQTKIQDELIANYKEHLKGSPAEGFIYKNKSIGTALKRMFLLHGVEAGFGGVQKPVLIKKSLDDGIDTAEFPMMVNGLRNGAYSRGALTQLAGAGVNLLNRMFQNILIDIDTVNDGVKGFCGTKDTQSTVIQDNKDMVGRYQQIDGKPVVITADDIKKVRPVALYTSLWCKSAGNDVCSICIGQNLSQYPKSMGTVLTKIPSTMMDKMMGSAHAKDQVVVPISQDWLQ